MIKGRRIYDEAVREAVITIWEAADRICGKRLKAALPYLVESMERHGHLDLDPEVRQRLMAASAATLDRLLKPIRPTAGSRRRRRRGRPMGKRVPVRTYNDWNGPPPGFLEIDLVAHCGGSVSGSFIHRLVATDICTGWTEAVPLLAREQSLVVEGLEAISQQLPFPILGIDSDNDGAFIKKTLITYCANRGIEFTRSRPYRSNDQAWIEQKNGSVVRRFVGHDRYSGQVAGQTMAYLYGALRLYVNYFQPSFKLIDKTRDGSTTVKHYSQPATPCDRLVQHDATGADLKASLEEYRTGLDPVLLLHTIREAHRRWWQPCLRVCEKRQPEKASNVSSPSCPICGGRAKHVPHTPRECEVRGIGAPARTPSRAFGATCWCGCRQSRMRRARR